MVKPTGFFDHIRMSQVWTIARRQAWMTVQPNLRPTKFGADEPHEHGNQPDPVTR